MTAEVTVAFDDLCYTSAHTFSYGGKPYTGATLDQYDDGRIRCRFHFQNGLQHGIAEEFYPTGAKRRVTPYVNGAAHGRTTEWHEDGRVHIERDSEYGIMTRCREYGRDGVLITEYVRPGEDPMMLIIQRRRSEDRLPENRPAGA